MSFKKVLTASALVICAIGANSVQAQSSDLAGYYVGGSLGASTSDVREKLAGKQDPAGFSVDRDLTKGGLKVFGGYQFDQNWAIEAGLVDHGTTTFKRYGFSGSRYDLTMKAMSAYTAVKLSTAPMNSVSFFAKAGLSANHLKSTSNETAAGFKANFQESDTRIVPMIGFGMEYDLSKTMALRAEVESFGDMGSKKLMSTATSSIGIVYKF